MDEHNVEIIDDEEIIVVDADEVFSTIEITIEEHDLEDIKDSETAVTRATNAVATAAKLQKLALEELENAEEARQASVRRMAVKYEIPGNRDWQINLSTGKIVITPERG